MVCFGKNISIYYIIIKCLQDSHITNMDIGFRINTTSESRPSDINLMGIVYIKLPKDEEYFEYSFLLLLKGERTETTNPHLSTVLTSITPYIDTTHDSDTTPDSGVTPPVNYWTSAFLDTQQSINPKDLIFEKYELFESLIPEICSLVQTKLENNGIGNISWDSDGCLLQDTLANKLIYDLLIIQK